jgi:hypothetical protein
MINLSKKFDDRTGVNLDISHRCALECPACTRYYLKQTGKKVPGHDMTDFEFDIILKFFEKFYFCGNISDPIFHPKFIQFLEKIYRSNKNAHVSTAATQKSIGWYKKAFTANPAAHWTFGLDGLPHQSWIYRRNQESEKLWDIMLLARSYNIKVTWQYIIFSYNENSIDEAKALASKHKIELLVCKTNRYPNDMQWLKPSAVRMLEPELSKKYRNLEF